MVKRAGRSERAGAKPPEAYSGLAPEDGQALLVGPATMGSALQTSQELAIEHLRHEILAGRPWFVALLEAMAMWKAVEEVHDGRSYRYLIGGEAFDWLLLAERLCQAVDGLIPEAEQDRLLFESAPPQPISDAFFRKLLGPTKHKGYLNYLYGVTLEEALIHSYEEALYKERRSRPYREEGQATEDVYQRIYGRPQRELLQAFRQEKGYDEGDSMSLTEQKEFTYWLFKYRMRNCHKARVACDTKRALEHLRAQRALYGLGISVTSGEDAEEPG